MVRGWLPSLGGRMIYCGECGQPGECACLGNWRERAEAAENKLADEKESRGWLEAQLRASDAKLARCVEALAEIVVLEGMPASEVLRIARTALAAAKGE